MRNDKKRVMVGLFCAVVAVQFTACGDDFLGGSLDEWRQKAEAANGIGIPVKMVFVPGGSFEMGKNGDGTSGNVTPVHTVTLSDFYMGTYEVTQAQYKAVMGTNPSHFKANNRPVDNVTRYDAIEFCNKLSERERLQPVYTISNRNPATGYPITSALVTANWSNTGYRLPTEAQWEYAAKGGNGSPGNYIYAGSDNPNDVAWYRGNSNDTTHAVGTKAPNGLGLYDMSGNVEELCWDWKRGGYWGSSAEGVRSAYRNSNLSIRVTHGFRLVRP